MGKQNDERDDDFEGFEQGGPALPDPPVDDADEQDSDPPARGEGDDHQASADDETDDDGARDGGSHRKDRAKKRIQQLATQRNEIAAQLEEERRAREDERRRREELEARLAKMEERESSSLEARLADLEARRKAALDDGELEEAITISDELADLRWELRQRPKKAEKREEEPQKPVAPVGAQQRAPQVPPATARWIERNSEWIHAQPAKLQLAARLESELIASGEYEKNSDDLYDALDELLEERMAAERKPRTQSFASPGVPNEPGNARPQGRQNRLTRDDISRMRMFNMDPDNPAHRQAWLKRNDPV